jgi:hypothetical protein
MKQFRGQKLFVVLLAYCCAFILFTISAQAAAYTVTTTADSGAGSLRDAIATANSTVEDDIINFSIPLSDPGCNASSVCTITLTSGELVINAISTAGRLTITNATGANNLLISGNNQSRVFYVNAGADLTVNGVTITGGNGAGIGSDDTNRVGGGIFNNGSLTITNTIVRENGDIISQPASGSAGGIFNNGIATLQITNSTITNNKARSGGGINNTGTLTIESSTLNGNQATLNNGGAILNTGTLTLTNSTVSGNSARGTGGGITNSGTATLTSSTVTNNTSSINPANPGGGGIQNNAQGTLNLFNTIVAGNAASSPSTNVDVNNFGAITGSYNLIGKGAQGLTNGENGNQVGTNDNPIDPKLGALANNGGSTQTHALLPDSPAIDKGNAAGTDQRGSGRPVDFASVPNAAGGNGADIGAYELQSLPTAASVTISGRVITPNGRGLFNALVALTNENGETRYARTSLSGRYQFNDVAAGSTVVITIASKRYSFAPQVLMVTGEALNIDFLAQDGLSKQ